MGSMSIAHWLIVFVILGLCIAVPIWFVGRITEKAGLSDIWKWAFLFPLTGLIALWVIAFSDWPKAQGKAALPASE